MIVQRKLIRIAQSASTSIVTFLYILSPHDLQFLLSWFSRQELTELSSYQSARNTYHGILWRITIVILLYMKTYLFSGGILSGTTAVVYLFSVIICIRSVQRCRKLDKALHIFMSQRLIFSRNDQRGVILKIVFLFLQNIRLLFCSLRYFFIIRLFVVITAIRIVNFSYLLIYFILHMDYILVQFELCF